MASSISALSFKSSNLVASVPCAKLLAIPLVLISLEVENIAFNTCLILLLEM